MYRCLRDHLSCIDTEAKLKICCFGETVKYLPGRNKEMLLEILCMRIRF